MTLEDYQYEHVVNVEGSSDDSNSGIDVEGSSDDMEYNGDERASHGLVQHQFHDRCTWLDTSKRDAIQKYLFWFGLIILAATCAALILWVIMMKH